jgi:hypothetical protein
VELEINADQETHGSLVVTNHGDSAFPADNSFEAEMNLWDQNGTSRSKIEVPIIGAIEPGESVYLSSGRWHLDPGVYFLTWGSPKYGGTIAVFSVLDQDGWLYLGKAQSFRTKPANYPITVAHTGRVEAFTIEGDGTLVIRGETPIPDQGCVFPLLFDQGGLLDGFPVGQCTPSTEGHWQLRTSMDTESPRISIHVDTNYRVILFSDDLTIAPSEPFELYISSPAH